MEDEVLAEQGDESSLLSGCRNLLRAVTKVNHSFKWGWGKTIVREDISNLKQLWIETSWDHTILAGYLYFTICDSLIFWSKSNVICQNQSNFSISSWLYLSLCSDNQIPIIVLSPQLSLLLFWILSWFPPALQSQYHQWSYQDIRLATQRVVQNFTTWPCLPNLWR